MWETIEPTWLSVFVPFVFFAHLSLKIAPKGAILTTLRTIGLTHMILWAKIYTWQN